MSAPRRLADGIALAGIVVSLAAYVAAALSYPGGSYTRPHAVGHDVLRNYVCDLSRETAHNGLPNPHPILARLALVALAVAFAAFAWRWVRPRPLHALGLVSAVGAVLVSLPVDAGGRSVHDTAIFVAGIPALVGSFLALRAQRRAGLARVATLGTVTLTTMAATAGAFVVLLVFRVGELVLPSLQKAAAILAMAWLARSALVTSPSSPDTGDDARS